MPISLNTFRFEFVFFFPCTILSNVFTFYVQPFLFPFPFSFFLLPSFAFQIILTVHFFDITWRPIHSWIQMMKCFVVLTNVIFRIIDFFRQLNPHINLPNRPSSPSQFESSKFSSDSPPSDCTNSFIFRPLWSSQLPTCFGLIFDQQRTQNQPAFKLPTF